jgi:hypothetical protein
MQPNQRYWLRSASSFEVCFMSFRWATLWAGLVALAPVAWSQQPELHHEIPEDAFGTRELILWSGVPEPPPPPQSLPSPDDQTARPDQRSKRPADPHPQRTPAQSFSGRIVRDGDRYVLKAAGNTTYELDEQTGVLQHENKNVHIVGKLDLASNTIHIVSIEPMS